ncbi:hypothetical protein CHARACLAT_029141 [Characodon lateralis]|uniref:Uncharacterized protein n=1 Tax=Characodon lateralis TaxID=208331 RepID=A0ABU7DVC5_9TELE|nr:hypothetical protein [Characodon lateralis]
MISSGQDIFHASELRHMLTVCPVWQHVVSYLPILITAAKPDRNHPLSFFTSIYLQTPSSKNQFFYFWCYFLQDIFQTALLLYLQSSIAFKKPLTTHTNPYNDLKIASYANQNLKHQ